MDAETFDRWVDIQIDSYNNQPDLELCEKYPQALHVTPSTDAKPDLP